jgi:hypothetical protein
MLMLLLRGGVATVIVVAAVASKTCGSHWTLALLVLGLMVVVVMMVLVLMLDRMGRGATHADAGAWREVATASFRGLLGQVMGLGLGLGQRRRHWCRQRCWQRPWRRRAPMRVRKCGFYGADLSPQLLAA